MKRIHFYFPLPLLAELRALAKEMGVSTGEAVRLAVIKAIEAWSSRKSQ